MFEVYLLAGYMEHDAVAEAVAETLRHPDLGVVSMIEFGVDARRVRQEILERHYRSCGQGASIDQKLAEVAALALVAEAILLAPVPLSLEQVLLDLATQRVHRPEKVCGNPCLESFQTWRESLACCPAGLDPGFVSSASD